jgi:hypothetical protein
VNYSKKKYGYILDAGDTSPLMGLSDRNKHHAMSVMQTWLNSRIAMKLGTLIARFHLK